MLRLEEDLVGLIDVIAGTRPNLVKAAAVLRALKRHNVRDVRFVYTSQHYDSDLFTDFKSQLDIPNPDVVFTKPVAAESVFADVFDQYGALLRSGPKPAVSIVFGDVTSTLACALVARYAHVPVAHVEAGLRSYNWGMPEEINRVAVDSLATIAFVTSESAYQNLAGQDNFGERIYLVGNTMIDTLLASGFVPPHDRSRQRTNGSRSRLVCTFHRPENVDDSRRLGAIIELIQDLDRHYDITFPVHPRTSRHIERLGLFLPPRVAVAPLPYFDFVSQISDATAVLTDSGGVSEETTFFGVPCLTVRSETERPETVGLGTNVLVGEDLGRIPELLDQILAGNWKRGSMPPLWDGQAGNRIVEILHQHGYTK